MIRIILIIVGIGNEIDGAKIHQKLFNIQDTEKLSFFEWEFFFFESVIETV